MISVQGTKFGDPKEVLKLVEDEDPIPSEGEVTIDLVSAPINPSDVMLIKGLYPRKIEFPATFGNEGIAKVSKLGENVTNVKVGDLVLIPIGNPTWRSKMVVKGKSVFPLPPADPLQMAMLSINPPTAYLMLQNFVKLEQNDWVIQNAANSAVGRYIIQLSKILGYRTINVVRRQELVEELKDIGADIVLVDGPNLSKQLREKIGTDEVKLGIDAVSGSASDRLLHCLSSKATLLVYGAMSLEPITVSMPVLMAKDVTVKTFWLSHWYMTTPRDEIQNLFTKLMPMIIHKQLFAKVAATYPLREFQTAIEHADKEGKDGKVLFFQE